MEKGDREFIILDGLLPRPKNIGCNCNFKSPVLRHICPFTILLGLPPTIADFSDLIERKRCHE